MKALQSGVHPLARRQRRAGLPLAVGRRPARRSAPRGSTCRGRTSRSRATSAPTNSSRSAARRRRGAVDHGQRRGTRRDRRGSRRVGRVLQRPGDLDVRRDARRERPSGAVRREVLGDRQRDLGRLGARHSRRRDLRAQLQPVRRRRCARSIRRSRSSPSATTTWPGTGPCCGWPAERIDYLAIHHYYGQQDMDGDLRNLMARPLHYERFYGELARADPGAARRTAARSSRSTSGGSTCPRPQQSLDARRALRRAADERLRAVGATWSR